MELGKVCELIVDCEHKTAPTQETGHPSIRTPNIGRGRFILDKVNRVSEEIYGQWTRRAIPSPGDLIMAREAPVGNVAMVPQGLKPCLGQRTLLIRCDRNQVEPAYMSYLLNGPAVQGTIHGMTNGATVAHLNMADVRALPIPELPSLPTQKKIAAILSAYDDLIENNERRIRILEEMAQNLYREWFVKFRFPGHAMVKMADSPLGKIPQGWKVCPLSELCLEITDGSHSSPTSVESGYPMASVKDMTSWSIDESSCRHISEVDFGLLVKNHCRPAVNDILIAKDGSYLKHVFVVVEDRNIVLLSSIAILRPDMTKILPHVLCMNLRQPETKTRLSGYVSGVAIPRIVLKDFAKFLLTRPPPQVQVDYESITKPMMKTLHVLQKKNRELRQTRDLLLPKLISGEADVSELDINVKEDGGLPRQRPCDGEVRQEEQDRLPNHTDSREPDAPGPARSDLRRFRP